MKLGAKIRNDANMTVVERDLLGVILTLETSAFAECVGGDRAIAAVKLLREARDLLSDFMDDNVPGRK